jgi:hypothetical protein
LRVLEPAIAHTFPNQVILAARYLNFMLARPEENIGQRKRSAHLALERQITGDGVGRGRGVIVVGAVARSDADQTQNENGIPQQVALPVVCELKLLSTEAGSVALLYPEAP